MKKRKLKRIYFRDIAMYNRRTIHQKSGTYFQFFTNKRDKKILGPRIRMRCKADNLVCKLSCLHMRWLHMRWLNEE